MCVFSSPDLPTGCSSPESLFFLRAPSPFAPAAALDPSDLLPGAFPVTRLPCPKPGSVPRVSRRSSVCCPCRASVVLCAGLPVSLFPLPLILFRCLVHSSSPAPAVTPATWPVLVLISRRRLLVVGGGDSAVCLSGLACVIAVLQDEDDWGLPCLPYGLVRTL